MVAAYWYKYTGIPPLVRWCSTGASHRQCPCARRGSAQSTGMVSDIERQSACQPLCIRVRRLPLSHSDRVGPISLEVKSLANIVEGFVLGSMTLPNGCDCEFSRLLPGRRDQAQPARAPRPSTRSSAAAGTRAGLPARAPTPRCPPPTPPPPLWPLPRSQAPPSARRSSTAAACCTGGSPWGKRVQDVSQPPEWQSLAHASGLFLCAVG